jgi:aminobenzoyl-glutamate utilization protein A
MTDTIRQIAQSMQPELVRLRRDIHRHAEVGWTEFRTAALIASRLKELGYSVKLGEAAVKKTEMLGVPTASELSFHMERAIKQGAAPELVKAMQGGLTGIVADLDSGNPGPLIALRFDIDSNDITETSAPEHLPRKEGFASVNPGAAHACGHDGHVAMGLGVATLLAGMQSQLKGSIRLIFEPGEEGSRGARAMAGAGVVDGVNHILGMHIGFQAKKTGQLICSTGKFLATTKMDVTYTGKPTHAGAAPQEGRNALLAAASAALNLHAIARHGQGATRITVGTLVAGEGRNVIPAHAVFKMETRGETSMIDEYMAGEAYRIIEGSAFTYGVEYHIEQVGGTKGGESSPATRDVLKKVAQEMGTFTEIIDYIDFGATEDYSHLMSVVQENGGLGTYFMLGADLSAGHHNDRFDFDESVLSTGVELMVKTVLALQAE